MQVSTNWVELIELKVFDSVQGFKDFFVCGMLVDEYCGGEEDKFYPMHLVKIYRI